MREGGVTPGVPAGYTRVWPGRGVAREERFISLDIDTRCMPRPQVTDETKERVDSVIEERVGIRSDFLTFNQKVEVVLDELKETEGVIENRLKPGQV